MPDGNVSMVPASGLLFSLNFWSILKYGSWLDVLVCLTGDTDTLYISNLPLRCGALELRRIFEEVGEVKDCRIVNNPVSRCAISTAVS